MVPRCSLNLGNISTLQGIADLVVPVFLRLRIRLLLQSGNGMLSATEFLGRLVPIAICGTLGVFSHRQGVGVCN